jgi:hypothetical protein
MSVLSLNPSFIRLPLMALGLLFAMWSAMTGIAAIDYFRSQGYLEAWDYQLSQKSDYQIPANEYQDALTAAQHALALVPYNSDYQMMVANMLTWQLSNTGVLPPAQRETLTNDVLTIYRKAITQRPSWPYSYSQFAITKLKLGQIDQEMMAALQKANQLGPREIAIIHLTIKLGMTWWPQLDQATQLVVAGAIDRSLSWNLSEQLNARERLYALSLVGLYQRQADICPLLTTHSEYVTNLCRAIKKPNSTKAHK